MTCRSDKVIWPRNCFRIRPLNAKFWLLVITYFVVFHLLYSVFLSFADMWSGSFVTLTILFPVIVIPLLLRRWWHIHLSEFVRGYFNFGWLIFCVRLVEFFAFLACVTEVTKRRASHTHHTTSKNNSFLKVKHLTNQHHFLNQL